MHHQNPNQSQILKKKTDDIIQTNSPIAHPSMIWFQRIRIWSQKFDIYTKTAIFFSRTTRSINWFTTPWIWIAGTENRTHSPDKLPSKSEAVATAESSAGLLLRRPLPATVPTFLLSSGDDRCGVEGDGASRASRRRWQIWRRRRLFRRRRWRHAVVGDRTTPTWRGRFSLFRVFANPRGRAPRDLYVGNGLGNRAFLWSMLEESLMESISLALEVIRVN